MFESVIYKRDVQLPMSAAVGCAFSFFSVFSSKKTDFKEGKLLDSSVKHISSSYLAPFLCRLARTMA